MSLFKSNNPAFAPKVRPLSPRPPAAASLAEAVADINPLQHEVEALRAQCEVLTRTVEDGRIALETALDQVERAYEEGEAEGRRRGLQEAQTREDQRLAAVKAGVSDALERWSLRLQNLEVVSMVVAKEAMAKIIGDPAHYEDLTRRAIAVQLGQFRDGAAVGMAVSAADFPDDAPANLSGVGLPVTVDDRLPSGACRITLRLGAVEVGIGHQWDRLAALLAEEGEA